MELRLRDISVLVAGARLVSDVNLVVPDGAVVGLVGPNGSGKSTVLRCVYRALRPAAGRILLGGEDLPRLTLRQAATQVAALTQDSTAEFDFTVAEIVAMGRSPHQRGFGAENAADQAICAAALASTGVEHLAARGFLTLSGGERQRVLIARALAQQPRVLVLDEPTNHLDIRYQLEVLDIVRSVGVTTLVALHDLNLAAAHCDHIYVLDKGRVAAAGEPRAVLTPRLVADVFDVRAHVVEHPSSGAPQLLYEGAIPDRPLARTTPPTR